MRQTSITLLLLNGHLFPKDLLTTCFPIGYNLASTSICLAFSFQAVKVIAHTQRTAYGSNVLFVNSAQPNACFSLKRVWVARRQWRGPAEPQILRTTGPKQSVGSNRAVRRHRASRSSDSGERGARE